jgi:transcriptional regulator with XRE-family HTH domain
MTATETIRATRQKLRLSQSELSRRASVSRWKLNTYELGERGNLNPDELSRIESVLRKEAHELASVVAQ